MITATLFLMWAAQPMSDVPEPFRQADFGGYLRCLRSERSETNRPIVIDGSAPTIVQFGQVVTGCGVERDRALRSVRAIVRSRHAVWSQQDGDTGAEFALSSIEARIFAQRHRCCDATDGARDERY